MKKKRSALHTSAKIDDQDSLSAEPQSIEKPNTPHALPQKESPHMTGYSANLFWLFIKTTFLTFFFLLIFLLITFAGVGVYAYSKTKLFTTAAGTSLPQLIQIAQEGWNTKPVTENNRINVLVLGTDQVSNRGNAPVLTDTIMISSLNLSSGEISLFSLPRDLWHVSYATRINALYAYGKDRYPTEPERFPREVIEEMTGVHIQHTFVITLDTLAQLIDQVGGVEIDVKEGFVDPQFPRSDVDIAKVHDPKLLYETVEFKPGKQQMDGNQVLKYVRSRHAQNDQGTDNARSSRQQEVIQALIVKFRDPQFYRDLPRLGRLYRFYNERFSKIISVQEAIGIIHLLLPLKDQIHLSQGAPSIFPQEANGVITHPPVSKYKNQWVYEIRDGQAFQHEVQQKLHF
jgi:LCP family protein required for cell wall assembly